MKPLVCFLVIFSLLTSALWAKRMAPKAVPPLVVAGVRYEFPTTPVGLVEAYDVGTGNRIWTRQVYATVYNPKLETDVQDRFIVSGRVKEGKLLVEVEPGKSYAVDLKTLEVSEVTPAPGKPGR